MSEISLMDMQPMITSKLRLQQVCSSLVVLSANGKRPMTMLNEKHVRCCLERTTHSVCVQIILPYFFEAQQSERDVYVVASIDCLSPFRGRRQARNIFNILQLIQLRRQQVWIQISVNHWVD